MQIKWEVFLNILTETCFQRYSVMYSYSPKNYVKSEFDRNDSSLFNTFFMYSKEYNTVSSNSALGRTEGAGRS